MKGEKQERGARLRDIPSSQIPPEVVDGAGNPVVISEEASALPQMNGSGMVGSLRASAAAECKLRGTKAKIN